MPYEEILYNIWLSGRYEPGSTVPGRLYRAFRTAARIYNASPKELADAGFKKGETRPLTAKSLEHAEKTAVACAKKAIAAVGYTEPIYPAQLRELDSPPPVIYCRGHLPSFDDNVFVSAVGTRKPSDNGKLSAHRLCFDLSAGGAIIISGMARGIDSMCHAGALDSGGMTIAVLGCGADVIYPSENEYLYSKIMDSGGIISEYPPGEEPKAENFPVRNRLIAALGSSVVVIEAGLGSGALITADCALRCPRPLYAVPGAVNLPSSKGSNLLLRQGARLCTDASDVLGEYELTFPHRVKIERIAQKKYFIGDYSVKGAPPDEALKAAASSGAADITISRAGELEGEDRRLYEKLIRGKAMTSEELTDNSSDSSDVIFRLMKLEIAGYVSMLPGGQYTAK